MVDDGWWMDMKHFFSLGFGSLVNHVWLAQFANFITSVLST
jgi:hypothetical protein